MLLLVDAGNTRVKWALVDDGAATDAAAGSANADANGAIRGATGSANASSKDRPKDSSKDSSTSGSTSDFTSPAPPPSAVLAPAAWRASGAVTHDAVASLGAAWQGQPVERIVIANVAGDAMRDALLEQVRSLRSSSGMPSALRWFVAGPLLGGVRNAYREPERLGCDRMAALIGARALMPQRALIVATCGTATTIDAMTAQGVFIGGMILPGLGTMAASLAQRTAQLPSVSASAGARAGTPFADNTAQAIEQGCLAAQAGAIGRAVAAHGNAHCVISGGAAPAIAPYLDAGATLVDNLVLIGLREAARDG